MRIDHCFLGDCRNSMREMLASGYAGKIQCIVTSPPYWGLRDYGVDGQLGLEPTPQEFVANIFATFPKALVEPCILAGSRPGDIFDPFLGSGTVAQVAQRLGRHWIGCELNPEYIDLQHDRTRQRGLVLES